MILFIWCYLQTAGKIKGRREKEGRNKTSSKKTTLWTKEISFTWFHLETSNPDKLFSFAPHMATSENSDFRGISIWSKPLKFARALSEKQIQLLQKGLEIYTLGDLFRHFPFRYEDKTQISEIGELHLGSGFVQVKGQFSDIAIKGEKNTRRLTAIFKDETGFLEVVWFQRPDSILKFLRPGTTYLLYGKVNPFNGKTNFTHPDIEVFRSEEKRSKFEPVYSTTETLKRFGLDSKGLSRLISLNLNSFLYEIKEPFPPSKIQSWDLMPLPEALQEIHQPKSYSSLEKAQNRLKLEELFPLQFLLLRKKKLNHDSSHGFYFPKLQQFTHFFNHGLPFGLTGAQKRVLKEIRKDLVSGHQMNRLVQGDVGSGKTIVAFLAMLMAIDNGFQTCLMAPTEILAGQHFQTLAPLAEKTGLEIGLLTGSTKASERKKLAEKLRSGELKILIGTHALIEETVQFQRLGLSVIDEQHRFGVAQRAKLHTKNENDLPPHILVMTATPIPRTLAMAVYGDLDVSVIDELPPGRREIKTVHRTESSRYQVFGFIREQISQGRQVYVVYPLIEESEALDLNDLMAGFESISCAFPEFHLSMVHGKMKPADKDYEMSRFLKGETQIMVATTVIEVGVNVPNASIMVIENSERFGLTQMHQLRGRVGRGDYQSFCILMTGTKLSREGKERIETLCKSSNGFEIAEKDLKMRGPGDLMGTKQSGIADLKLTNLSEDGEFLEKVKTWAEAFAESDPELLIPENQILKLHLSDKLKEKIQWSKIS
jgi:ATP-dependent DNA helicase RecG